MFGGEWCVHNALFNQGPCCGLPTKITQPPLSTVFLSWADLFHVKIREADRLGVVKPGGEQRLGKSCFVLVLKNLVKNNTAINTYQCFSPTSKI